MAYISIKGVMMPAVSAGSNQVGARETCEPTVIRPSGAALAGFVPAAKAPSAARYNSSRRVACAITLLELGSSWSRRDVLMRSLLLLVVLQDARGAMWSQLSLIVTSLFCPIASAHGDLEEEYRPYRPARRRQAVIARSQLATAAPRQPRNLINSPSPRVFSHSLRANPSLSIDARSSEASLGTNFA